ncbi:MAG: DMT family transporter [Alphaproteobacteria bacterium]
MSISLTSGSKTGRRQQNGPVLLVLASALFWGLWWVPVRLVEALGLTGVWPNLGINLGALLGLGAAVAVRRGRAQLAGSALIGSVLIGIAVAFYGAALSLTDVARAVLLFYLAPAWSTLIEVAFFGQRWQWRRLLPLLLSFGGMIAVFRGDITLDGVTIGDLAAFASGIAWAVGAALVFATGPGEIDQGRPGALRLGFLVMIAAVATSVLMLPIGWQGWPRFESADAPFALLLALAAGGLYLAPIIGVTLWGATRLTPTTISFLLAAEILSGITSSALLLDERFGFWEMTGTVMIVASVIAHIAIADDDVPGKV